MPSRTQFCLSSSSLSLASCFHVHGLQRAVAPPGIILVLGNERREEEGLEYNKIRSCAG